MEGKVNTDWMAQRSMGAEHDLTADIRIGRRITKVEDKRRRPEPAVYFVTAGSMVKIGRVARPERLQQRISDLQAGCPDEMKLRFVAHGYTQSEEKALHKVFRAAHHRGEWFRADGKMADFLQLAASDIEGAQMWLDRAIGR